MIEETENFSIKNLIVYVIEYHELQKNRISSTKYICGTEELAKGAIKILNNKSTNNDRRYFYTPCVVITTDEQLCL